MAERREAHPGELWWVDPIPGADGSRAVMAVVEARGDRIDVVMTGTDPENATDHSLVFAPGEAAPWPVRVQCDLPGIVGASQLASPVGTLPLPEGVLRAAVRQDVFAPGLAIRRGTPIHGPSDTRVAMLDEAASDFWSYWMAEPDS